jgi:putative iron-only hydrogenase system regulator
MKRIAVIGAILENPEVSQKAFNDTISSFKGIVKGRMGIPVEEENLAVISITLQGDLDEINSLTGKLGNLPGATVKTAVSSNLKSDAGAHTGQHGAGNAHASQHDEGKVHTAHTAQRRAS